MINQANQIDNGKGEDVVRNVDSGLCLFAHGANWYKHRGVQSRFASRLLALIEERRQQVLARETPETFAGYRYLADCDMQAEHFGADVGLAVERL